MPKFMGMRQRLRGGAGAGRGDNAHNTPSSGPKPPPPPRRPGPFGAPPPLPPRPTSGGSSTPPATPNRKADSSLPHGPDGIHRPQAQGGTPKHGFTEWSSDTSYELGNTRDRLRRAQKENKAKISSFAVDRPDKDTRMAISARQVELDDAVEKHEEKWQEHESLKPRRVAPPKK